MTSEELFAEIQKKFPKIEKAAAQVKNLMTLKATKEELIPLCSHLKERLGFDYLDMVTAVDWKGPVDPRGYITDPNPNPFLPEGAVPQMTPTAPTPGFNYREAMELIYLLTSLERGIKVFLRVELPREQAQAPSLVSLYKAADWQEREVFDLFGIRFEGHPNLKKILTPDFIQGHPLRKDYVHQKDRFD